MPHQNIFVEPSRQAIQKVYPNLIPDLVDQYISNLLWNALEYKWLNEKIMLFVRLSGLFCPFQSKVMDSYRQSVDWMKKQSATIIYLSEEKVPCLTVAGQVEYFDTFFPYISMIGKNLLIHASSSLGTKVCDKFAALELPIESGVDTEKMEQAPLHSGHNVSRVQKSANKHKFPRLSIRSSVNSMIGSSVDIDRFLEFCLDEHDYKFEDYDSVLNLLYQASNVTHENGLSFLMFRSICRLVNANYRDSQVQSIFQEGCTKSDQLDIPSLYGLEKKYKIIRHIPKIPLIGDSRCASYIKDGWDIVEPQLEAELGEAQRHFESGRITAVELHLLKVRVAEVKKATMSIGDVRLVWTSFLILVNDLMHLAQQTSALEAAEVISPSE